MVIDANTIQFAAVAIGAVIGIIIPMVSNFNTRGHAIAGVVIALMAVVSSMVSSGQLQYPLFFGGIFAGYFAAVAAQGQQAAKQANAGIKDLLKERK